MCGKRNQMRINVAGFRRLRQECRNNPTKRSNSGHSSHSCAKCKPAGQNSVPVWGFGGMRLTVDIARDDALAMGIGTADGVTRESVSELTGGWHVAALCRVKRQAAV